MKCCDWSSDVCSSDLAASGMERATADYMGMLGTVMNALAMQNALEKIAAEDPWKIAGLTLGDVIDHPALFHHYPELRKIHVNYVDDQEYKSYGASFNKEENRIELGNGLDNDQLKQALLHEVQHAIQEKEDFAIGGSPTTEALMSRTLTNGQIKDLYNKNKRYSELYRKSETGKLTHKEQFEMERLFHLEAKRLNNLNGQDRYTRLAGEVEARDVSARMNLSEDERAASSPLRSQGIPAKDMIVRLRDKKQ
jgi:hypothetical protein